MTSAAIHKHDTPEEKGGGGVNENSGEVAKSRSVLTKTRSDGGWTQLREVHGAYLVPLGLLFPRVGQRSRHGRHCFLSKRRPVVVGVRRSSGEMESTRL